MNRRNLLSTVALTAVVGLGAPATAATAHGPGSANKARIVAHFDLAAGEVLENVVARADGGADLTLALSRQIVRVTADGRTRTLATVPAPADGGVHTPVLGLPIVTGLTRSGDGTLYFLYTAGDASLTGLWQLRTGGTPRRIAALPAGSFPNGVALDERTGTFYIADSVLGRIWSVPASGGVARIWARGLELAPTEFLGANGLKLHDGAVWVSNTDRGTIVRLPLNRPGKPTVRASGLVNVDDFQFTGHGDQLLAALNASSEVVRVDTDGRHRTVLTNADGVQNASAVDIRNGNVYVTSAGLHTGIDPNLLIARLSAF